MENELLPAKAAANLNTKLLAVIVEALDKLDYRPEAEIAIILQELAVTEDAPLLRDRFTKASLIDFFRTDVQVLSFSLLYLHTKACARAHFGLKTWRTLRPVHGCCGIIARARAERDRFLCGL